VFNWCNTIVCVYIRRIKGETTIEARVPVVCGTSGH